MPDDPTTPEQGGTGTPATTFTPPVSQADLDKIIGERVARERAKYADYADMKAKAARLDAAEAASKTEAQRLAEQIAALTGQVAAMTADKQHTGARKCRKTPASRRSWSCPVGWCDSWLLVGCV